MRLAGLEITQLPLERVQPGDILCTAEHTTSSPAIMKITCFQQLILSCRRLFRCCKRFDISNVSNMVHFEIALKVDALNERILIAHADGSQKTVVSGEQSIRNFSPGTLLVVMRPPDEGLRRRIVKVAENTVNKGNKWGISSLNVFKSQFFNKVDWDAIARLVVDAYEGNGFSDAKGRLLTMNCSEYAHNVLLASHIWGNPGVEEILKGPGTSRTRIDLVKKFLLKNKITKINGFTVGAGLRMTPADLVMKLMKEWNRRCVQGFLGIAPEENGVIHKCKLTGPFYEIDFSTCKKLKNLNLGSPDEFYFIFKELGLLFDGSGYHVNLLKENEYKLMSAFIYLYSIKYGMKPLKVMEWIASDNRQQDLPKIALEARELFQDFCKNMKELFDEPRALEKKTKEHLIMNKCYKSRIDKSLVREIVCVVFKKYGDEKIGQVMTISSIHSWKDKINKIRTYFNVAMCGALLLDACTTYGYKNDSEISLGRRVFVTGVVVVQYLLAQVIHQYNKWENNVVTSYHKKQPTHSITVITDAASFGQRLWMRYQVGVEGDYGTPWHNAPAVWDGYYDETKGSSKWMVQVSVPEKEGYLFYKFFIGSGDDKGNPCIENARWQCTADGRDVRPDTKGPLPRDRNGLLRLPDCHFPAWQGA